MAGRGQADLHEGGLAAAMQERELEAADAGVARGKQALELVQEAPRSEKKGLGVVYFGRKLQRGAKARRRREKNARLGTHAQGPVEILENLCAAPFCEPFARQPHELPDRGHADVPEKL